MLDVATNVTPAERAQSMSPPSIMASPMSLTKIHRNTGQSPHRQSLERPFPAGFFSTMRRQSVVHTLHEPMKVHSSLRRKGKLSKSVNQVRLASSHAPIHRAHVLALSTGLSNAARGPEHLVPAARCTTESTNRQGHGQWQPVRRRAVARPRQGRAHSVAAAIIVLSLRKCLEKTGRSVARDQCAALRPSLDGAGRRRPNSADAGPGVCGARPKGTDR
ncbi:MAG: hypothetical protein CM15mP74_01040 [Halieaceae bacterium]|nr:MAG: hypothetical protein CM15mP74_01040 [Halieaceae bacterium]